MLSFGQIDIQTTVKHYAPGLEIRGLKTMKRFPLVSATVRVKAVENETITWTDVKLGLRDDKETVALEAGVLFTNHCKFILVQSQLYECNTISQGFYHLGLLIIGCITFNLREKKIANKSSKECSEECVVNTNSEQIEIYLILYSKSYFPQVFIFLYHEVIICRKLR